MIYKSKAEKGFALLEGLLILIILGILGGVGWYVWDVHNKTTDTFIRADEANSSVAKYSKKSNNSSETDKTFSGADKSKYINNYDKASPSLKKALIEVYFGDARKQCINENNNVSPNARNSSVMAVQQMVRDDFAGVQFCGSGGTSIFAKIGNDWKVVGSLAMAPACSIVDKYKISKQITPSCFLDDRGATRSVAYE